MKIVVITGSPHRKGTSALLADRFIEGACGAGHEVFRFNAAFESIHPCLACDHCGMNGPCVQKDAIEHKLKPELIAADLVVFVTPLYYFGMSAQLKTVIDRFYSANTTLMESKKKSILMVTAYDDDIKMFTPLVQHYKSIVEYLGWQEIGMVLAKGCGTRADIESSEFPGQAYKLGVSL